MTTHENLKAYLKADITAGLPKNLFFEWLSCNDSYRIHRLQYLLRRVEYYSHNHKGLKIIPYLWNVFFFRRMRLLTDVILFPDTIGPGLKLVHPGFRRIGRFVRIGKNCTILPMVLFGRKKPSDVDSDIIVGDDCYISTGATILGPVTIGNNVTIGAGAVVTKDIPDNAIVGGVPAKIIRYK